MFIIPGMLIAIVGLITFAFFETDSNYKFTHSVWHACVAFAILFILPSKRLDGDKVGMLASLRFLSKLLLGRPARSRETPLEEFDGDSGAVFRTHGNDTAELLPNLHRSPIDDPLLPV